MKLTPGVNFINILRTAFDLVDPKSVKKDSQLDCLFFTLLGSAGIKAVRITLMKSSPGHMVEVPTSVLASNKCNFKEHKTLS